MLDDKTRQRIADEQNASKDIVFVVIFSDKKQVQPWLNKNNICQSSGFRVLTKDGDECWVVCYSPSVEARRYGPMDAYTRQRVEEERKYAKRRLTGRCV